MKNKKVHLKIAALSKDDNKPAVGKLAAFCSTYLLLKSDEELCHSFESFVSNYSFLENDAREEHVRGFQAIKAILPVLHELGDQICAERIPNARSASQQPDSSNHLYASLKRHPE